MISPLYCYRMARHYLRMVWLGYNSSDWNEIEHYFYSKSPL